MVLLAELDLPESRRSSGGKMRAGEAPATWFYGIIDNNERQRVPATKLRQRCTAMHQGGDPIHRRYPSYAACCLHTILGEARRYGC
jgi:hypothetical protein